MEDIQRRTGIRTERNAEKYICGKKISFHARTFRVAFISRGINMETADFVLTCKLFFLSFYLSFLHSLYFFTFRIDRVYGLPSLNVLSFSAPMKKNTVNYLFCLVYYFHNLQNVSINSTVIFKIFWRTIKLWRSEFLRLFKLRNRCVKLWIRIIYQNRMKGNLNNNFTLRRCTNIFQWTTV